MLKDTVIALEADLDASRNLKVSLEKSEELREQVTEELETVKEENQRLHLEIGNAQGFRDEIVDLKHQIDFLTTMQTTKHSLHPSVNIKAINDIQIRIEVLHPLAYSCACTKSILL